MTSWTTAFRLRDLRLDQEALHGIMVVVGKQFAHFCSLWLGGLKNPTELLEFMFLLPFQRQPRDGHWGKPLRRRKTSQWEELPMGRREYDQPPHARSPRNPDMKPHRLYGRLCSMLEGSLLFTCKSVPHEFNWGSLNKKKQKSR